MSRGIYTYIGVYAQMDIDTSFYYYEGNTISRNIELFHHFHRCTITLVGVTTRARNFNFVLIKSYRGLLLFLDARHEKIMHTWERVFL